MGKLNFKAYKIEEIQFVNKIKTTTKIEIKNSYSYNVRYTNQNICEGKFTININDKVKIGQKIAISKKYNIISHIVLHILMMEKI